MNPPILDTLFVDLGRALEHFQKALDEFNAAAAVKALGESLDVLEAGWHVLAFHPLYASYARRQATAIVENANILPGKKAERSDIRQRAYLLLRSSRA